jgi:hypothetical protein
MIYYFVTVQVSAKNVKIVTTTFRSKFLKQSSSSVTMKSNKAFPIIRHVLPLRNCTIPIRLCGGSNTVRRIYGFCKQTASVSVCVVKFRVSEEPSTSIMQTDCVSGSYSNGCEDYRPLQSGSNVPSLNGRLL